MFGIAKIVGDSMSPTLVDGDFVITFRHWRNRYRIGDIVSVDHPRLGPIIKRICSITQDGHYWLAGDNRSRSSTSDAMGEILPKQIKGKLIWHIAKEDS